jgi:hypothetical protein
MKKRPTPEADALPPIEKFAPDTGTNNKPGLIYAANEARFTTSTYNVALTGYTVGWRDPEDLQGLLDALFPSVPTDRLVEFKKADNAAVFLTEDDDERPIGGTFKRVETRGSTAFTKTINRGLTTRIDHDQDKSPDRAERKAAWLKQRLLRNEFIRCLALLRAAAHSAGVTWDENSNPDGELRKLLREATDTVGMRPTIVAFGELAWDARLDVYETINTPYAGRAASMTTADLASKLMVDRVQQVKARYQATANDKTAIVPSIVLAYMAQAGLTKDDPSNFKRFMSMCANGLPWATYVHVQDKFTDVTVEHYSGPTITSSLGIEERVITNGIE